MIGPDHVPNPELREGEIPAGDAEVSALGRFALTFDPREHWRESWGPEGTAAKCKALAERTLDVYAVDGTLPGSLSELRSCLQHFWVLLPYIASHGPNQKQERYLRDLVEAIRDKVARGEIE